MPEFEFTGQPGWAYPELKDTAGQPVGVVDPGDIRDLEKAPDSWWVRAPKRERSEDGDGEKPQAKGRSEPSGKAATAAKTPEAAGKTGSKE